MENKLLPDDINYDEVTGLRLEAREKLKKIRLRSFGQASRISGVSPADISGADGVDGGSKMKKRSCLDFPAAGTRRLCEASQSDSRL